MDEAELVARRAPSQPNDRTGPAVALSPSTPGTFRAPPNQAERLRSADLAHQLRPRLRQQPHRIGRRELDMAKFYELFGKGLK